MENIGGNMWKLEEDEMLVDPLDTIFQLFGPAIFRLHEFPANKNELALMMAQSGEIKL